MSVHIDSAIGVDPGPATGICLLDYHAGRLIGRTLLQAEGSTAVYVLKALIQAYHGGGLGAVPVTMGKRAGSVEKFVTGAGAGSRGGAAEVTRQLVMELAETLELFGYKTVIRPAANVKPWASDKRLTAAGVVAGKLHGDMNHAGDAARHALYGAHEAGIITDPLIRRQL